MPRYARRRTGSAHTGQIQRAVSNERWCSDGLEIVCWNEESAQLAFALDCHDRECLAWVAVPRDLRSAHAIAERDQRQRIRAILQPQHSSSSESKTYQSRIAATAFQKPILRCSGTSGL